MRNLQIPLYLALATLFFQLASPCSVRAQEREAGRTTAQFAALAALDASYGKQLHDLDCRRLTDLAALAEKSPAGLADAAYRQLFGLAIGRNLCQEAQTAAERCLASASSG